MNNSDNRDPVLARRRLRKLQHDRLIEQGGEDYARILGLDRRAAPLLGGRKLEPEPTVAASTLAHDLLAHAKNTIRTRFAADPSMAVAPLRPSPTDDPF